MSYRKCISASIFFFYCILSFAQSQNPWATSTPEAQGMNSLTLVNSIKHFQQDTTNFHSLLIIRNDHIILDACFYPFQKKYVHDLASVTKSITSILIGIAIDKEFIKNEDQLVLQYFPEYPIINDTLKILEIKDLLNMASGLQCSWDDGEKELKQMNSG
jgi:CubicO group peptidase (beta-lactamase class C family)